MAGLASAADLGILSSAFTATTGLKVSQPFPKDGVKRCPLCGAEKSPPPAPPAPQQSWYDWMFGRPSPATTTRPTASGAGKYQQLESREETKSQPQIIKLTARDLFGMTYGMIQPQAPSSQPKSTTEEITVHVHMLKINAQVTINVKINSTVKELRKDAAEKLKLSPQKLMLIYDNSQLEDHQEIKYQGMTSGCMIFGMICSPGQKMGILNWIQSHWRLNSTMTLQMKRMMAIRTNGESSNTNARTGGRDTLSKLSVNTRTTSGWVKTESALKQPRESGRCPTMGQENITSRELSRRGTRWGRDSYLVRGYTRAHSIRKLPNITVRLLLTTESGTGLSCKIALTSKA